MICPPDGHGTLALGLHTIWQEVPGYHCHTMYHEQSASSQAIMCMQLHSCPLVCTHVFAVYSKPRKLLMYPSQLEKPYVIAVSKAAQSKPMAATQCIVYM